MKQMKRMGLESGKRYWFYASDDTVRVRSGLYTGKNTKTGSAILVEKNGTVWNIPERLLYASPEEAQSCRKR